MHCLRNLCLFAMVVGAGCNVEESNTTAVTTGNTNGNATVASATLPTVGGGMEETGAGGEVTGSGEVGEGASSGGEAGSMAPVDTNTDTAGSSGGDVDGDPDGTGEPGSTDSTAEAGSTDGTGETGSSGNSGETETTGGDLLCDSSLLLAMTPGCVQGFAIESAAWADAFCTQTFGDGWIWLEHHQQGGWYVEGTWIDDYGIGERGWVYVNDQASACYETNYGVTWVRAAFPDWQCRADCWSTIGLEGPQYNPQDGEKCNSYEGDTPCDHCRPLICARP